MTYGRGSCICWRRCDPGHVSLFSPRIADMGQVAAVREALHKVAEGEARNFLNYPTRDAYQPVRQAAADWIARAPVGPVSERDVVLTHGGQNGIMVVLQAILQGQQPVIMVEDLTYAGFRRAAELLQGAGG